MASKDTGKGWVCEWIRENFPMNAQILDVGACDGKWRRMLFDYPNMEAVEAWEPNCENIRHLYRRIYCGEMVNFDWDWYDLIIFGDVIEHMTVEDAQQVLRHAYWKCSDMIVAVPFLWKQGPLDGNPYEEHIQDDLTPEIMKERYPMLEVLHEAGSKYCYYHKRKPKTL
jgi:hypothetical protein